MLKFWFLYCIDFTTCKQSIKLRRNCTSNQNWTFFCILINYLRTAWPTQIFHAESNIAIVLLFKIHRAVSRTTGPILDHLYSIESIFQVFFQLKYGSKIKYFLFSKFCFFNLKLGNFGVFVVDSHLEWVILAASFEVWWIIYQKRKQLQKFSLLFSFILNKAYISNVFLD